MNAPPIPHAELPRFQVEVRAAFRAANDGQPDEGFLLLDLALSTIEQSEPHPGREELIHRYRRALVLFTRAYGLDTQAIRRARPR